MSVGKVRIAVVDDHSLFLAGLSELVTSLHDDFEAISFTSGFDLIDELNLGETYDLVITDLAINQMNGLMLVKAIRKKGLQMPIAIVSGAERQLTEAETFSSGADRFVPKSADFSELSKTIFDLLGIRFKPVQSVEEINLAPRQMEILRLMVTGASNREISTELSISENTVKTHLKNIYLKLEVSNRVECVQKVQSLGIVKVDMPKPTRH
jgi:DNA-binding NarL/FixJ family response regulator